MSHARLSVRLPGSLPIQLLICVGRPCPPPSLPRRQASILHYAKQITEVAAEGTPIVDCVITVPAWFGQAQRSGLLDAAELAGLNVLSLINSHAAAALQFGIERNFSSKVENVIFFDMGAASTEVGPRCRPTDR
jgi:Hsp70 protein